MPIVEHLFLLTSLFLALAGLTMVGLAVRAYLETTRRAMIHLSIGFTLVAGGTIATTISAFLNDFETTRRLLLVNSGFSTFGYIFVIYSLIAYE